MRKPVMMKDAGSRMSLFKNNKDKNGNELVDNDQEIAYPAIARLYRYVCRTGLCEPSRVFDPLVKIKSSEEPAPVEFEL